MAGSIQIVTIKTTDLKNPSNKFGVSNENRRRCKLLTTAKSSLHIFLKERKIPPLNRVPSLVGVSNFQ
jgi:hypothetical protein